MIEPIRFQGRAYPPPPHGFVVVGCRDDVLIAKLPNADVWMESAGQKWTVQ